MNKLDLDKEKIILVVVLASVFVLICVYTYFQFYAGNDGDHENKAITGIEQNRQNTIDLEKHKQQYQERIRKIKNKEEKNRVEVNLSLDIFKEDKIASSPTEEVVETIKPKKRQTVPEPAQKPLKTPKKVQASLKVETQQKTTIEMLPEEAKIEIPETGFVRTFAQKTISNPVAKPNNLSVKIPAIVYNDHSIRSGSKVTLRTTEAQQLNGQLIPANTFVYGIATFSPERILIKVSSILVNGKAIPVDLTAVDLDGMEGLYAPGKVEQEIAADAANSALNQTRGSVNTPLGSITVGAGKKKVNDPVRHINNKYKLILKNKS